jgi:hypothetical protein
MNTPILKFAEQAGLYVDLNGKLWPRAMSAEESEVAYKKFAELIIQECAIVANEYVEEIEGVNYGLGRTLKKYFRVEE